MEKSLYVDSDYQIILYSEKGRKSEVRLIALFSGESIQIDRFSEKEKPLPIEKYLEHTREIRKNKKPLYLSSLQ